MKKILFLTVCLLGLGSSSIFAQWGGWTGFGPGFGGQFPAFAGGYPTFPTYANWGWPGYGPGGWNMMSGPLGKVQIKTDVDYSDKIDGGDLALGNEPKRNPHGLIIGEGEMTKFELYCEPNAYRQSQVGEPKVKMDFYKLVASLEVQGINLAHPKGRFASFEDEMALAGRVRVWLDSTRSQLLLDSANPEMRRVEWPYASSVPPKRVFVEGVRASQPGAAVIVTMEIDDSNKKGISRLFGEPAIWDRQLISIHIPGVKKPYVDETPVWSFVGGTGK